MRRTINAFSAAALQYVRSILWLYCTVSAHAAFFRWRQGSVAVRMNRQGCIGKQWPGGDPAVVNVMMLINTLRQIHDADQKVPTSLGLATRHCGNQIIRPHRGT
jgi:hypothetical protein